MTSKKYKKKCAKLFQKAKSLGIELMFYPGNFHCKRLNCLWYGGHIATLRLTDRFEIELNAYGDVYAVLTDQNGETLARVKDKSNCGAFEDEMRIYITTDKQLKKAISSGRLDLDYGNWIEYDGVIKQNKQDERGEFIDLGIICDNILDDDILTAIEQALDSADDIKEEIIDVAQNHYSIQGVGL